MIARNRRIDLSKALIAKIAKLSANKYSSNSALAEASGIHRNTISRLINGKLSYIDKRTHASLMKALE